MHLHITHTICNKLIVYVLYLYMCVCVCVCVCVCAQYTRTCRTYTICTAYVRYLNEIYNQKVKIFLEKLIFAQEIKLPFLLGTSQLIRPTASTLPATGTCREFIECSPHPYTPSLQIRLIFLSGFVPKMFSARFRLSYVCLCPS